MAVVSASVLARWLPVAVYMAAIFYVSGLPDVSIPAGTTDKPWHLLAYLGLAVLVCRALAGGFGRRLALRTALTAIVITTLYGVSDEAHQIFVPLRSADWRDLVADAIGAVAGTAVAWAWGIIASTVSPARGASRDEL